MKKINFTVAIIHFIITYIQIHEEVSKRKAIHQVVADRTKLFQDTYQRLHPNIWNLNESFFDKRFLDLIKETKSKSRKNLLHAISQNDGFLSGEFHHMINLEYILIKITCIIYVFISNKLSLF